MHTLFGDNHLSQVSREETPKSRNQSETIRNDTSHWRLEGSMTKTTKQRKMQHPTRSLNFRKVLYFPKTSHKKKIRDRLKSIGLGLGSSCSNRHLNSQQHVKTVHQTCFCRGRDALALLVQHPSPPLLGPLWDSSNLDGNILRPGSKCLATSAIFRRKWGVHKGTWTALCKGKSMFAVKP